MSSEGQHRCRNQFDDVHYDEFETKQNATSIRPTSSLRRQANDAMANPSTISSSTELVFFLSNRPPAGLGRLSLIIAPVKVHGTSQGCAVQQPAQSVITV